MAAWESWPSTHATLLLQIRDRTNRRSWESFASTYAPLIYGYCRRKSLQHVDAQDVMQDIMEQVSNSIQDFEYQPHRGRFRSWLGTVTFRAIRKHRRNSAHRPRVVDADLDAEVDRHSVDGGHCVDSEWCDAFNAFLYERAMSRIRPEFPEDVWKAFLETFNQRQPANTVAAMLERSTTWVYQAKFRVVHRLEEELIWLAGDTYTYSGTGS